MRFDNSNAGYYTNSKLVTLMHSFPIAFCFANFAVFTLLAEYCAYQSPENHQSFVNAYYEQMGFTRFFLLPSNRTEAGIQK